MPLVTCHGCHRQISDAAPACIHCGIDRTLPPPPPARSSGISGGVIALIAAGGVLGVVFFVGILAAIAIPKFASVSRSAKYGEAKANLLQLAWLEQAYRERNGTFTANLTDWMDRSTDRTSESREGLAFIRIASEPVHLGRFPVPTSTGRLPPPVRTEGCIAC